MKMSVRVCMCVGNDVSLYSSVVTNILPWYLTVIGEGKLHVWICVCIRAQGSGELLYFSLHLL